MAKYRTLNNGVIVFDDIAVNDESASIAANTVNTWQTGRSDSEKLCDTQQGKAAESKFEYFMSDIPELNYCSYDEFRIDDNECHAPLDGLIWRKASVSDAVVKRLKAHIALEATQGQSYGHISGDTHRELWANGVRCVEIKSTKVVDRHRVNGDTPEQIAETIIHKDDFLIYPCHCRNSSDPSMDYSKYKLKYCGARDDDEILKEQWAISSDIYIRVYLDYRRRKTYLVRYSDTPTIIQQRKIKHFPIEKSKNALYYAMPLLGGKPLADLEKDTMFDI